MTYYLVYKIVTTNMEANLSTVMEIIQVKDTKRADTITTIKGNLRTKEESYFPISWLRMFPNLVELDHPFVVPLTSIEDLLEVAQRKTLRKAKLYINAPREAALFIDERIKIEKDSNRPFDFEIKEMAIFKRDSLCCDGRILPLLEEKGFIKKYMGKVDGLNLEEIIHDISEEDIEPLRKKGINIRDMYHGFNTPM